MKRHDGGHYSLTRCRNNWTVINDTQVQYKADVCSNRNEYNKVSDLFLSFFCVLGSHAWSIV